jgi:hypothetical protein
MAMSGTLPFLAIGLLLIALLILLLLRPKGAAYALSESSQNEDSAPALFAEPFPQQLGDRLFGSEDWDFVVKERSARLRRLFLQQRTALALSWLRGVRGNATKLIRVHSAAARTNSRLEPLVEVRVVVDYLFFQVLCQILALAIWLRGPVNLSRFIRYADDLSKQLYEVSMRTQSRLAQ